MNMNEYRRWVNDNGETKRYNYNLNNESIVFDVGGFHGEWTTNIFNRYKSIIYIFEPVQKCINIITEKINNNNKIHLFEYGLGGKNEETVISLDGDAASVFNKSKNMEQIKIVDISDFISENNINYIDLIKINIEGGEYELLDSLLTNNHITKIKNIQIQFHDFVPGAIKLKEDLQSRLSITHKITYKYDFVWENWELF